MDGVREQDGTWCAHASTWACTKTSARANRGRRCLTDMSHPQFARAVSGGRAPNPPSRSWPRERAHGRGRRARAGRRASTSLSRVSEMNTAAGRVAAAAARTGPRAPRRRRRCRRRLAPAMSRPGYDVRERIQNRFAVDQREALFGKGGGARNRGGADDKAAASREMIERQNDAYIEDLEGKVGQLKDLTTKIGGEISSSNSLLDAMGIDFDKAGSLLKGTMSQLKVMMNNKDSKHMCYMVIFVFALFFLMYVLRKMPSFGGGGSKALQLEADFNASVSG